ncbi:hypothetical protein [Granulicella sibirica]|uniref:DUF3558 domain-containing protein n=1 Tax=Granulicella sibirica TaxID=2479048 RepID=A0A4Q0SYG5_9BACT|nr:hypothetical protein [Granulicella sibirica]RXH54668.1 hypothetical protein GRAN_3772 [Granulicella sibirica]
MKSRQLSLFALSLSLFLPATLHAARKDACSLIASSDAQAALGEPVGPSKEENRSYGKGEATSCQYRSTLGSALRGKSVSLEVRYSDDDLTGSAKGIAESLQSAGFKDVHLVAGAGSAAVWGSNSILGRTQGELTVIQGKSVMLIIIISGIPDEADAISKAKAMALKALASV